MQSANTLFAKVTVKKTPYAQIAVAFRITASFDPNYKVNNAQFFSELPLELTTMQHIENTIAKFAKQANALNTNTTIQPAVFKMLDAPIV